jgi:hypothetical protein
VRALLSALCAIVLASGHAFAQPSPAMPEAGFSAELFHSDLFTGAARSACH